MKYIFSFKEINHGSIEIESDHEPDTGEVIDAIMNGGAYIGDTEYEDIRIDGDRDLSIGADGSTEKEAVQGYAILRSIAFENNRGFALAENLAAPSPYVTWQFTEDENGVRDYCWGHYASSKEAAARDYESRIFVYKYDYGISEKDAYKYYSTQRPVDIGTYPKTKDNTPVSIVNFDTREGVETGRVQAWGYLVYDAPLTEKQISDYELHAAPDNPDVKALMREQAQTVGAWEEKRGLPAINRYTDRWLDTGRFIYNQFVTPKQMAERFDHASRELTRAAEKQTMLKPIREQFAEAAKMVERGEPAKTDKKQNRDER
jgi:hypothetical protein